MQEKTFDLGTTFNSAYVIECLIFAFNLALIIAIAYFVIKLYRKLIKFLDQNTKP
jgi:hypothetical protein